MEEVFDVAVDDDDDDGMDDAPTVEGKSIGVIQRVQSKNVIEW